MIMAKDINKELDRMDKYIKDALVALACVYNDVDDLRIEVENATVKNAGYLRPDCTIRLETTIKETVNDRVELTERYGIKLDPREKDIWSDILKRFE